ncbi:hypothetical protein BX265_7127 [Streptomyces sp. TLI_235]|nr:hypothetical protein [Streptomyces sp. TLI_235]PBC69774.1 hypothetical protein BX265_7127 [Streptomyces sp. TLI_235]
MPVYHPNSGDPCYDAAKGKSSQCAPLKLGWRWNLDFVVDPHGNVQRYDWFAAGNNYAMGRGQSADSTGTLTPYTRGGYLTRISYGYQLADALAGREPSARVVFEPRERCTATDSYCTEGGLSTATASHWPDTPYDLGCPDGWLTTGTGDTVCRVAAPTFWADKRLGGIHTELRGAGGWQNVDRYDLTQVFSDVGATTDPATARRRSRPTPACSR